MVIFENWPTYCHLAWALAVATASFLRLTVATSASGGSEVARRVRLATGSSMAAGATRMGLGMPELILGSPAWGDMPQDTLLVAPLDPDNDDGRGPTVSPCSSSSSTLMTLIPQFFP